MGSPGERSGAQSISEEQGLTRHYVCTRVVPNLHMLKYQECKWERNHLQKKIGGNDRQLTDSLFADSLGNFFYICQACIKFQSMAKEKCYIFNQRTANGWRYGLASSASTSYDPANSLPKSFHEKKNQTPSWRNLCFLINFGLDLQMLPWSHSDQWWGRISSVSSIILLRLAWGGVLAPLEDFIY